MRFAFFLLVFTALVCRAQDNLSGRWEGTIQIPDRELPVVVDLGQTNSGAWQGSIIITGLGIKGASLAEITAKDTSVSFKLKTGRGLEGTFSAGNVSETAMSGNFVSAGNTAPFSLKKTGPPQIELPPHSTAVTNQMEGEWKGDYELLGYSRHVTLKLGNSDGSPATADFVVIGRKVNNIPVDLITQEGDLLTIESEQTGIGYEGRLNKSGNQITGIFSQGPIELPLVLRRTP